MTGPRVAITTLGCKVNAYDGATIADRLRAAGCEIVDPDAAADVVIVNSCTVTYTADAESRRLVRRARLTHPAARVILTGCYAQTRPMEAAAVGADRICPDSWNLPGALGLGRRTSVARAGYHTARA